MGGVQNGRGVWAQLSAPVDDDLRMSFGYSTGDGRDAAVDLLVVPAFLSSQSTPDVGLGLADACGRAGLTGAGGEDLLFPAPADGSIGARSVLVVGLGDRDRVSTATVREAAVRAGRRSQTFGSVATTLAVTAGSDPVTAVRATIEGFADGGYRFAGYATRSVGRVGGGRQRIEILGDPAWPHQDLTTVTERAAIIERAVAWGRDLVNIPAGQLPPDVLAEEATRLAARFGLAVRVWEEEELRDGGFGGILGVGLGSDRPSRMIELRYRPPGDMPERHIALVGKGVTFDSGGLSLKDPPEMIGMKADMAGAASILAAIRAVAELGPPDVAVTAVLPSSENMPGGSAMRPGDVIRHHNGLTTEVVDTDCEGRLLLADGLSYAAESRPTALVDVATLTYSVVSALGEEITGALGNDPALIRDVIACGSEVGEPIWELPLWRNYRSHLDSPIADLRNEARDEWAGAIVPALFLEEFVAGVPWVHLDVGGTAYLDEAKEPHPEGASGVPTRTLVRLVTREATSRREQHP
ncbi:MAG TPA: leucyl aminopeptidase [Nocardioides sp.]|nr:leucyl aminopeptidase [Nocardioides sp.]